MPELDGQVAIVTGASRGIGLAIAGALADAGAAVCLCRQGRGGSGCCGRGSGGRRRAATHVMWRIHQRAPIWPSRSRKSLVPVTILVNNAGVTRDNVLVRLKDEDWTAVMDTNLRGAFNLTRSVGRGMMKRRSGRIINIASVVGLTGNRGQANYAASKAGLIGFSKSAALELASRGVLVNVVAPGFIATDMTAELGEATQEELAGQIPLGRIGEASDIAGVVRFLAGPASTYMTGQVLVVDGGMVMHG